MNSREQIMNRLRGAVKQGSFPIPEAEAPAAPDWSRQEKTEMLKQRMEAVRSEVHVVPSEKWTEKLKEILGKRNPNRLLCAPESPIGKEISEAWKKDGEGLPPLALYEGEIEDFKEKLFATDAAVTSTIGGIAETGALILWPDEKEPRLMSLVPSVHIAVLDADKIYNTFTEVMEKQGWKNGMPTNALLISGPSKTADIELVLAFGVHGPKELIVLVRE